MGPGWHTLETLAMLDMGWRPLLHPHPLSRNWRPVWVAILTVGSKACGAMTTEGKSCLHLPTNPQARAPGKNVPCGLWTGGAVAARC